MQPVKEGEVLAGAEEVGPEGEDRSQYEEAHHSRRLGSRWPPALKKNTSWPISPLYSIYIQKKVRDQNKMSQTHLKSFNGRQW